MTGAPTWYDLLDVAPDASTGEVRAAWRARIADLEPGERRFEALNRAARVLLDPDARAAYDASLAEDADPSAGEDGDPPGVDGDDEGPVDEGVPAPVARPRRRVLAVPSWLLLGLGVVATALVGATGWVWLAEPGNDGEDARAAQSAAERAAVPVLSYDHADLAAGKKRAQAWMTGAYREEYDKLFSLIEDNAPGTRTTVDVDVVSSGIVRTGEDRVQVLVFVDRPTTNKATREPVVYRDQVTLAMQRVDDEWLVDDMTTSPVGE